MTSLAFLKTTVQRALRQVARVKDVQEAEVFASSTDHLLCRLNYTSEIPCQGVEEPKSSEAFGVSIRAIFKRPDGLRLGFGSETRDLSPAGIRRALEKARQNAVPDSELISLPKPELPVRPTGTRRLIRYHDRAIMELKDRALVESSWQVITEALKVFASSEQLIRLAGSKERLAALGLIIGGDVSLFRQRIAVASTHLPKVQTDESTYITSFVTSMVERGQAKGSGYDAVTRLSKLKGGAGGEAAARAILAVGGQRVPSGTYAVVLGPQPVADLMANVILPSLSADAFYSSRSAFLGELKQLVASPMLTVYDHGAVPGLVGTRRITCEGLPTGRTDLIKNGVLQGLLSNYYETQRLLHDPHAREKLGVNPQEHRDALVPRNGFRISPRGGRHFEVAPSIATTNVFIEGGEPHTAASLLRLVNNGLYIGRIWYTYPINGLRAGDFTCTVVGDSYLICEGRIATPIQANVIRLSGNIRDLLRNIVGMTKHSRPIVNWGASGVIYAPEIAIRDLQVSEIAQFMESM